MHVVYRKTHQNVILRPQKKLSGGNFFVTVLLGLGEPLPQDCELQEGKVVERPKYIYSEARHSKTKIVKMHPKPVIIFEGLYALFYKDIRK